MLNKLINQSINIMVKLCEKVVLVIDLTFARMILIHFFNKFSKTNSVSVNSLYFLKPKISITTQFCPVTFFSLTGTICKKFLLNSLHKSGVKLLIHKDKILTLCEMFGHTKKVKLMPDCCFLETTGLIKLKLVWYLHVQIC